MALNMLPTTGIIILCALVLVANGKHYRDSRESQTKVEKDKVKDVAVKEITDAEFPCPDESEFLPCVCEVDVEGRMAADCSAAANDEELANAFTVTQSFLSYKSLTISPLEPTDLNTLTIDTFGGVGFETIEIIGTNLKVIEDGAFASSEPYLTTLQLQENAIEDFPFESLPKFEQLTNLNLRNNTIGTVQNLESNSLVTLNLNNNPTLDISLGLFGSAPLLETLDLRNCGIDDLPTDMFLSLERIATINLSSNQITQLRENAIGIPQATLVSLDLSDNQLYDMAVGAINIDRLIADTTTLSFENNEFVELCDSTWDEMVTHLAEASINLAGNPLRCGCDMVWLFDGNNLYAKLDSATICSDGSQVQGLDPEVFETHCDPMPSGICPAPAKQKPANA